MKALHLSQTAEQTGFCSRSQMCFLPEQVDSIWVTVIAVIQLCSAETEWTIDDLLLAGCRHEWVCLRVQSVQHGNLLLGLLQLWVLGDWKTKQLFPRAIVVPLVLAYLQHESIVISCLAGPLPYRILIANMTRCHADMLAHAIISTQRQQQEACEVGFASSTGQLSLLGHPKLYLKHELKFL